MKIKALIAALALAAVTIGAVAWAAADDDGDSAAPTVENPAEPGDTSEPADPAAGFDHEAHRAAAQALLGTAQGDLSDEIRIGRVGDEYMMLTEDYVLGRMTVGVDDTGAGPVVTDVTVEMPDGPETFELDG